MIKATIMYGTLGACTWQEKSFRNETIAIEWCRRNAEKIGCINNYRTSFKLLTPFEIVDALRGRQN